MKKVQAGQKVALKGIKKIVKVDMPDGSTIKKAVRKSAEGMSELVQVTAGKNFKSHFLDHKKLLENVLGTRYPKLKNDGARFLEDISKCINDGTVEFVGKATVNKDNVIYKVYRGNGITITTKLDNEWHTLLESGKGMDLKFRFID